jgi:hypothetical protein
MHLQFGVSIKVPDSLRVIETVPADFALYRLSNAEGKLLMVIYLGDHPDMDIGSRSNFDKFSNSIGGFKAESVRWRGKDGRLNGSTLIHLPARGTDPSVAHLLFRDLSNAESKTVEGVIRSFGKDSSPDRK